MGRARGGFSLLEIMTVIAVISILTGLLAPIVDGDRREGTRCAMEQQAKVIEIACNAYVARRGTYPAHLSDLVAAQLVIPGSIRLKDDTWLLVRLPSAPGRPDIAGARVVALDDWEAHPPSTPLRDRMLSAGDHDLVW